MSDRPERPLIAAIEAVLPPLLSTLERVTWVQRHLDPAVAGRAIIPAAPVVSGRQVAVEDPPFAVQGQHRVLDVNVIDPLGEAAQELDRIDPLPV